jgi:hypothetical protein
MYAKVNTRKISKHVTYIIWTKASIKPSKSIKAWTKIFIKGVASIKANIKTKIICKYQFPVFFLSSKITGKA